MSNVFKYTFEIYIKHFRAVLLFSLSFIIALAMPLLAQLPTYMASGGIFLRLAGFYNNTSSMDLFVIVVGVMLSLLFLSFSIVAINVLVKHSRTYRGITEEVVKGLEKYTSKVFAILLLYMSFIVFPEFAAYYTIGHASAIAALLSLLLLPLFFYAPNSIVIDDSNIKYAIKNSFLFFIRKFHYFLLWITVAIILVFAFNFIFLMLAGSTSFTIALAKICMLVFNAVIIMPFLVILQSEIYMQRFPLLRG
ncbi:MAG: hypothetical protein ACP5RP_01425 [Candidatus Micrarchaeia archaeon]